MKNHDIIVDRDTMKKKIKKETNKPKDVPDTFLPVCIGALRCFTDA